MMALSRTLVRLRNEMAGIVSRPIVGSRAHLHLDVIFCIAPHLERCT